MNFTTELETVGKQVRELLLQDSDLPQSPKILRELVLAYPGRGGKAMRPALLVWCCALYSGNRKQALRVAAAVEVQHVWTLVHDDIIDADAQRRGGPSAHVLGQQRLRALYPALSAERAATRGENMAMLAGDVQHAWANRLILDSRRDGVPDAIVLELLQRLNHRLTPRLIAGEAADVLLEEADPRRLEVGDILSMLRLKTGLLLRFAAEAGALVGLGTTDWPDAVRVIGELAECAGLAFQMQDDLLGIYGDAETLGKPIGSDLRQGKRTLLIAEAMPRVDAAGRETLLAALGDPDLTEAALDAVRGVLRDCGAVAAVEERLQLLLDDAERRLWELPDNEYRELLSDWLHYVRHRQL